MMLKFVGRPSVGWHVRSLSTAMRTTTTPPKLVEKQHSPYRPPSSEMDKWETAFVAATDMVNGKMSYGESVEQLRTLSRTGLMSAMDLRNNPSKFFAAHRLLARHAVKHGPGFWIRFTVSYNLCYGTVLAVGNDEQVALIKEDEMNGRVGCFGLTETFAGVQSGLVVKTKAVYDKETEEFRLESTEKGTKFWISQGLTADRVVVIADLEVDGVSKGPHAFLSPLLSAKKITDDVIERYPGMLVGDMGEKTTGNDLDNAWMKFEDARFPKSSLLSRYCEISEDGEYKQLSQIKPFDMVGQRLYTGRIAVAQAALAYRRELFDVARGYAVDKPIPTPPGTPPRTLASLPQLRSLFVNAEEDAHDLETFVASCERRLAPLCSSGEPPDAKLAQAIATAKVRSVETSLDHCWRLKNDLGSYSLIADAGFKHLDFLTCCKFAEGDSRILMQKMARDRLRKGPLFPEYEDPLIADICDTLNAKLSAVSPDDKKAQAAVWDDEFLLVYRLADLLMDATIQDSLHDSAHHALDLD